jgi:hypothetical protein
MALRRLVLSVERERRRRYYFRKKLSGRCVYRGCSSPQSETSLYCERHRRQRLKASCTEPTLPMETTLGRPFKQSQRRNG